MNRLSQESEKCSENAANAASETLSAWREKAVEQAQAAGALAQKHPFESIAIGFAAGALLGLAVGLLATRRSRSRRATPD